MAQDTLAIDERFFGELREARLHGATTEALREKIRSHFSIPLRGGKDWERRILFGVFRDGDNKEDLVGSLIAIAPGIIVLDADAYDPGLSGILSRPTTASPAIFCSKSFLGITGRYDPRITFYPSTFPENQPRYTICPAWIAIDFGGDGTYLGIDPSRWGNIRAWLDRWLPQ